MKFYYVYIVECSEKSFYIGFTSDLEKRIQQHNVGLSKSAYTFTRRPVILKWYEQFTNPDEAIRIEKKLKGWSRRKKIALINEDWEKLVEYSKNYTQFWEFKINKDIGRSSTGSD